MNHADKIKINTAGRLELWRKTHGCHRYVFIKTGGVVIAAQHLMNPILGRKKKGRSVQKYATMFFIVRLKILLMNGRQRTKGVIP